MMKKLNIKFADGTKLIGIEVKKINRRQPSYQTAHELADGTIIYASYSGYYTLKQDGTATLDTGLNVTEQNVEWEVK